MYIKIMFVLFLKNYMFYWSIYLQLVKGTNIFKSKVLKSVKKIKIINKSKFIRERRYMVKSKAILKKRSTKILIVLDFNISTNILQNIPPISTVLSLYGLNSLKFCEEFNVKIKQIFFEHLYFKMSVVILRDLTYKMNFGFLKVNYLLQSLFFHFFKFLYKFDYCLHKKKFVIVSNFDGLDTILSKNYTIMDLWFSNLIKFLFFSKILNIKTYNLGSDKFLKLLLSNIYSYKIRLRSSFIKYKYIKILNV
jgi:hypothetical protein